MTIPTYGVDYTYYATVYYGEPVEQANFDKLLSRSMDVIYPLIKDQADRLFGRNDYLDEQLKHAICSQIEYISVKTDGGNSMSSIIDSDSGDSFTLGKFSMSGNATSEKGLNSMISQKALGHLKSVGLISNRIGVRHNVWY